MQVFFIVTLLVSLTILLIPSWRLRGQGFVWTIFIAVLVVSVVWSGSMESRYTLAAFFVLFGFTVPLLFMLIAIVDPSKITRNSIWIHKIAKRTCESRGRLVGLCFVLLIVMLVSGGSVFSNIEEYRIQTEPGYGELLAARRQQDELDKQRRKAEKAEQKEAKAKAKKARNFSASISDTVTLGYSDSSTSSFMAINDESWDMLSEALVANDTIGLTGLAVAGLTHLIQPGTKALVLDRGFTSYKVRVLNGPNRGAAGWVVREFVQP